MGLLFNSWHSDRSGERKWHAAVPIFCAACCYALISPASGHLTLVVLLFTFFTGLSVAAVPSVWAIPTMLLSDTTAAAFFGLITSFAQIGAFIGPSFVGRLNDKTHSLHFSLVFIAASLFCSALCFSSIRLRTATEKTERPARSSTQAATF